ncbi:MAG: AAA family ATPase [Muribaculaceae bacterium]|nr:AAA family ATPase [Muribaculaceae bacterium]
MDPKEFAAEVLLALPYRANDQQVQVVAALARFCSPEARPESVFILNGYAGTGKTSLTGALVRTLGMYKREAVLLAPTGRAAKVFSANSAGHPAFTIHRKIYRHNPGAAPGVYSPPLPAEHRYKDAVFIVDEASMIAGQAGDSSNLLEDLITYVYAGDNCRLILIGDTAQLPPVGNERSVAMEPEVLRRLGLKVTRATLTETARQAADSGILYNATRLRRAMTRIASQPEGAPLPIPKLRTAGFDDVTIVEGEDLPEMISKAYGSSADDVSDTILITRSNRRATEYNTGIRTEVLYREEELTPGDLLIVARNHYFTKKVKGLDFVANGDILCVRRVIGTEVRYGIRFADVELELSAAGGAAACPTDGDDAETPAFTAKIILDTLADPEPTMSREMWNNLYYSVLGDNERYGHIPVDDRLKSLRTDPYWNALLVKYAYAVTCHKAQGGQWNNVFVDLSYIPDDALGMSLYRWLYTAVTRARKHLYLISPPGALLSTTDNAARQQY